MVCRSPANCISLKPPRALDPENGGYNIAMRPSFENKFCAPGDLPARVSTLPRQRVFTNGVFDVLHRGHVTYLAEARAFGASLIVALNSDASAKRLGKGDDRPVNTLEDRMALIAALESVDLVTWFDDDTPLQTIVGLRPDVLVKGGDWPHEKIVGVNEVESWGGSVHAIAFQFERSTTLMLEKIRRAQPAKLDSSGK